MKNVAKAFIMFEVGMIGITLIMLLLKIWYPINWLWILAPLAISLATDLIFITLFTVHMDKILTEYMGASENEDVNSENNS